MIQQEKPSKMVEKVNYTGKLVGGQQDIKKFDFQK